MWFSKIPKYNFSLLLMTNVLFRISWGQSKTPGNKRNVLCSVLNPFSFQIQQYYSELRRKGLFQNLIYAQISRYGDGRNTVWEEFGAKFSFSYIFLLLWTFFLILKTNAVITKTLFKKNSFRFMMSIPNNAQEPPSR